MLKICNPQSLLKIHNLNLTLKSQTFAFAWNSCWIFRVSYQALKCPTSQKESCIIYGLCNVIWYDDDQSAAIWVSWSVLTFSGFISNSSHKILNLIWHVLAMIEIAVKSLPWNPNKREQVLRSRGRSNRFCSSLIWLEKTAAGYFPSLMRLHFLFWKLDYTSSSALDSFETIQQKTMFPSDRSADSWNVQPMFSLIRRGADGWARDSAPGRWSYGQERAREQKNRLIRENEKID